MQDSYTLDKQRVRAAFDRAARSYDAAAILQKEVRERMLSRLDLIKIEPKTILDAGAGTGHAGRALAQRYQGSYVVALDIAMGMLRQSGATQPWWRKWIESPRSSLCADIEQLPLAAGSMDFIWSSLAIQWCNDLDATFAGMARALRPDGLLMFSTFGPDTLKELRSATAADPDHVHVSRFIDMHDIGDALVRSGFSSPVLDVEHFVVTYDDVLGVMRDLQAIGARNAAQGRRRGLEGKGFLRDITERYERFRKDGKLPATFEVVYGHAWKSPDADLAEGVSPITIHRRS
jgi:malonyl-CoA O-methyltransferase